MSEKKSILEGLEYINDSLASDEFDAMRRVICSILLKNIIYSLKINPNATTTIIYSNGE